MKITLDPGHGYHYNQGVLPSYYEGDRMCNLAFRLKKALETYPGLSVTITRQRGLACAEDVLAHEKGQSNAAPVNNGQVSIAQRANIGNGSDLFLSLHSNAAQASVRGSEIWLSKRGAPGQDLAEKMVSAIAGHFVHRNRGLKYDLDDGGKSYGVLHSGTAKVKLLVESGFHSNSEDCRMLMDDDFLEGLAQIMAKTIVGHYKLEGKLTNNKSLDQASPRLSLDPLHKERRIIATAPESLDFAMALSALISAPVLLSTTCHNYFRKYDAIIGTGPDQSAFTAYLTYHIPVRDADSAEDRQALMNNFDLRPDGYRI